MIVTEYLKPSSIAKAYELLMENKKNTIIAGGAWLKLSLKSAEKLISLDQLELDSIQVKDDVIEIGSMVTLRSIETNVAIKNLYDGILSKALGNIMGINIRNIATIGGSIMGKLSFSDIFPVLEVLDTTLVFYKQGEVDLEDFLNNSTFEKDILVKVRIKNLKGEGFFKKVATTPLDFSIINVACSRFDGYIKISVGSTPYMAKLCYQAMDYINTVQTINDKHIDTCVSKALEELKVSNNNRASKAYRVELIKVYIKRGILQVINDEN